MTVIDAPESAPPLSVADAAEKLGVSRRVLSLFLYEQNVPRDVCPIISGRRIVPASLLPSLAIELRRARSALRTG